MGVQLNSDRGSGFHSVSPDLGCPLAGVGCDADRLPFLSGATVEGALRRLHLSPRAGGSLGCVLRLASRAKGFFFNASQNVQRPCVKGFGGGRALFSMSGTPSVFVAETEVTTHEFQQVGNHFHEDGKFFQGVKNERVS